MARRAASNRATAEPGSSFALVETVSNLTPTVKKLDLRLTGGAQAAGAQSFVPGQWVDLFIPGVPAVGGYSLCSDPIDLPRLTLAVKSGEHPPTRWCCSEAEPGDEVQVRVGGSFGVDVRPAGARDPRFELPPGTRRLVLVAGGIGISPLYSILGSFARSQRSHGAASHAEADMREVVLLFGARARAELAFESEIAALARACDQVSAGRVRVVFVVPDAPPEAEAGAKAGAAVQYVAGSKLRWRTARA